MQEFVQPTEAILPSQRRPLGFLIEPMDWAARALIERANSPVTVSGRLLEIGRARKHWKRWLGIENRCVVPFTSFSEFNKAQGGDIWFALDESRPLAAFAGIWTNWTSVRKVKEGETNNDLFGFLTTEPNDVVAPIHAKAMPVILTSELEIETWLTAPPDEALKLQRPLPAGTLAVVAKGSKKDGNV
jgi:putative SOS response-associated peptidase YedK